MKIPKGNQTMWNFNGIWLKYSIVLFCDNYIGVLSYFWGHWKMLLRKKQRPPWVMKWRVFYVIWGRSIIYAAVPQNCVIHKKLRFETPQYGVAYYYYNDNKNNGSKLNWIWSWLTVITNNNLLEVVTLIGLGSSSTKKLQAFPKAKAPLCNKNSAFFSFIYIHHNSKVRTLFLL